MKTRRRRARGKTITVVQDAVLPRCVCPRSNAYLQRVHCYYSCKMFEYYPLHNLFNIDDPKYIRELANAAKLRDRLTNDIVAYQMSLAYTRCIDEHKYKEYIYDIEQ